MSSTTVEITNLTLQEAVEDELLWDPAIPAAAIGVSVSDHAVTLTGIVSELAIRLAAVNATRRVKGVRSIADDIVVRHEGQKGRTDHDIAGFIEHALEWNSQIPDSVRATVRKGTIILDGEVAWHFQRMAAERIVEHIAGVNEVKNHIVLTQPGSPTKVHDLISAALHRQADVDSDSVRLTSDDGTVTLTGSVSSWDERERVEAAAWAAPGVHHVANDLAIV